MATFVPVQAHRRISTLQLVARLPGTIAGARRRFGGGASLCLHPGVARAVAAFTIELTRPDDCVSLAGGASRTPLRRQAPALTAARGPGPFRSIASDRRPAFRTDDWIKFEILTHQRGAAGARLIIFSWCRQGSWRHPFFSPRSRPFTRSRPFKGLIFALDNLARESNKGQHLTWRGLQDEPQGEFLIEVDDLNLLNLYVPFWSWETIEARFVQAVLEL